MSGRPDIRPYHPRHDLCRWGHIRGTFKSGGDQRILAFWQISVPAGASLYHRAMRRSICRQRRVALSFSRSLRRSERHCQQESAMQSFVLEFILTFHFDVRDSECLSWRKGKRYHGGNRCWSSDRLEAMFAGTDFRRVHESRPFACACHGFGASGITFGFTSPRRLSAHGLPCLPVGDARTRLAVRYPSKSKLNYASSPNSKRFCLKTSIAIFVSCCPQAAKFHHTPM